MRVAVSLVGAVALLFSGCGASESTEPSEQNQRVLLTVFAGQSTSDPGIEDMINELVAREVPEVDLHWEMVGWGGQFEQQIHAKFAAGEVPDLIVGKAQDVAAYLPSGNLAALPSRLTQLVQPVALPSVSQGGQVYGLPYNAFYQGVLYNKNIFRRLNLPIPQTPGELAKVVASLEAQGITPFASHFLETWYLGNIFMQMAIGEVFGEDPTWGQRFLGGKESFRSSPGLNRCFDQLQFLTQHTWSDAFALDYTEADRRFSKGEAAMYLTGSWSLQNVSTVNVHPEFGIFPYPNSRGNARLIFEPNLTFMKSSRSEHSEAIDRVLQAIGENADLASRLAEFTKTASLLTVPVAAEPLLIQEDVDRFGAVGRVVDATSGNSQLIWAFQSPLAEKFRSWLQGTMERSEVLGWADANRELSAP